MSNYNNVGYALSNAGLIQGVDDEIREKHSHWNDKKVEQERNKILKQATLFNGKNKQAKKPKKNNGIGNISIGDIEIGMGNISIDDKGSKGGKHGRG